MALRIMTVTKLVDFAFVSKEICFLNIARAHFNGKTSLA